MQSARKPQKTQVPDVKDRATVGPEQVPGSQCPSRRGVGVLRRSNGVDPPAFIVIALRRVDGHRRVYAYSLLLLRALRWAFGTSSFIADPSSFSSSFASSLG